MELLKTCIIVCPMVFLAGFVDAVAGGGGLISLPAYLFAGLPAHLASGTNKVVNAMGTALAAGNYIKSGKIDLRAGLTAALFALIGSAIGTRIALHLDQAVFQIAILVALPVVAVILTVKRFRQRGRRSGTELELRRQTVGCRVDRTAHRLL